MEKYILQGLVIVLLVLLAVSVAAQSAGSVVLGEFQSDTLSRTYQYKLYLPAGYDDSDQTYPVIYLLHGRGDTMDAWLNIRDVLDEMVADGRIPPLIAVMPDMPSSDRASYYVDSQYEGTLYHAEAVETAFMHDLIPHIDGTYRTITTREGRIVGGYSMGGYGSLRYAMAYPETFIGAIVLSPAVYIPLPPLDSSTREFGAFGSGQDLFDDEIYLRLNYPSLIESLQHTALPLHMFIAVGDDEWKNPNPEDRLHDLDIEAHMVFNQLSRVTNVDVEFRVYNGGHDWDVWQQGFAEGLRYLTNFLHTGDDDIAAAGDLDATILDSGGDDFAGDVAADDDGNTYLAFGASGAINGANYQGEMDAVLLKLNARGDMLWTIQFGTDTTERPYGLALDSSDNIIVAGYTNGNLDGSHAGNDRDDIFVAKFDSQGQQRWMLQAGDMAEADRGYALAVASDDSLYVAGYTRGLLGGENAGDKDIVLLKLGADGTLQWVEQFGGIGEDKGLGLAVAADGTVYVSGVTGSELETSLGDLDAFLAAYTANGEQIWLRQFGSTDWDEATSVTTAPDGTIYVTGFVAGDFDGHSLAGDKDMFVAAFDYMGHMLWSDLVGTNLNDKGADILADGDGSIFVAGYSNGNLAGRSGGGFDIVLMLYAREHTRQWILQIGTAQDDGADQWAEKNLAISLPDSLLLLSGLTGDTAEDGSGDVFLSYLDLEADPE